ncbi:helix-turn-helix domain-containing protein [Aliarcobacter butzleri]|uniref:helix-turn-helix domain-containing protein n=1 Tax=Aliarcobacter butzleri TaxID=28197 RepID=UPI0024DE241F|nr:helix-turn-helix transcriptional regulator [Aliarcobacter butzleri]MDK2091258.1 helix-turn-helix transcriptional regulator [Aliarcobacter butzleri]
MTKEEFCYRLKELNLTQKDFANIAHIPYSTLNNWGTMANGKIIPVPSWVRPFLEHYDKSIKYDAIREELIKYMTEKLAIKI